MNLTTALIVYVIIAVLVFILARVYRIRTFSAVVLALVIGQIAISLIRPDNLATEQARPTAVTAYLVIQLVTSLLVLVYVIGQALSDRDQGFCLPWMTQ